MSSAVSLPPCRRKRTTNWLTLVGFLIRNRSVNQRFKIDTAPFNQAARRTFSGVEFSGGRRSSEISGAAELYGSFVSDNARSSFDRRFPAGEFRVKTFGRHDLWRITRVLDVSKRTPVAEKREQRVRVEADPHVTVRHREVAGTVVLETPLLPAGPTR